MFGADSRPYPRRRRARSGGHRKSEVYGKTNYRLRKRALATRRVRGKPSVLHR
jgi:hypothetical protein